MYFLSLRARSCRQPLIEDNFVRPLVFRFLQLQTVLTALSTLSSYCKPAERILYLAVSRVLSELRRQGCPSIHQGCDNPGNIRCFLFVFRIFESFHTWRVLWTKRVPILVYFLSVSRCQKKNLTSYVKLRITSHIKLIISNVIITIK